MTCAQHFLRDEVVGGCVGEMIGAKAASIDWMVYGKGYEESGAAWAGDAYAGAQGNACVRRGKNARET